MENNIGVGIIVGIAVASSSYVWYSNDFTKNQKYLLLLFILFPPLQWISILIILIYNSTKNKNSTEKINERKLNQVKTNLDSSINNLTELKNKGILTDLEYYEKIAKIKTEKVQQDIQNLPEYKQLKSLLDSGILTKEEFENKTKNLKVDKNSFANKLPLDKSEKPEKYFNKLIYQFRCNLGVLIICSSIINAISLLFSNTKFLGGELIFSVFFLIFGILLIPNLYSFLVTKIWK